VTGSGKIELKARNIKGLPGVNIGQSILSRAVSVGLSRAVDEMLVILE